MILLPAIDIKDGQCVRLLQGDYDTAQVVAEDPVKTAKGFQEEGARWLHMVDLDGAKDGKPVNAQTVFAVRAQVDMHIELGGGIRDMETLSFYLEGGVDRVILGSAALHDPAFVKAAVKRYSKRIAVGVDAIDGKVAVEGWLDTSEVGYLELAREMDRIGVSYLIVTDISKDGTLQGPNLAMLDRVNHEVRCNVIASGGVSSMLDIINLYDLGLYGAIAGRSLYAGTLDLASAIVLSQRISGRTAKNAMELDDHLERYFRKSELIPAVIQEADTGAVLMLAYMNQESLQKTIDTGTTWFYSRSRNCLWNKGETSGHFQRVKRIYGDCDDDSLLVLVDQKGVACHTGKHSCFYKEIYRGQEK